MDLAIGVWLDAIHDYRAWDLDRNFSMDTCNQCISMQNQAYAIQYT